MQNEESLRLYQRLDDFERCLEHYKRFCLCHKSFLVNLDFAPRIEDNTFSYGNRALIPISRSSYKESKLAFYNNKVNWW
jgi:DNA-binding LytR/AlgR family response regulator